MKKYQAFVKTVEFGSFTKAAESMNYSQSGISKMVAELEKEWGLTLLERDRGGIRLTADGQKLLPLAKKVLEEYSRLQTTVDELNGLNAGIIRIGTFSSVATHWLPNIIRRFQADYPNIDYEILIGDYTEINGWLEEGRVDCGFLPRTMASGLECISLAEDRLLAVLPEGHPLESLALFPIKALCEEPFMLLKQGKTSEVSELLDAHDLHPDIRFTTLDDYAIMSMVESGLGISVLPELILKRNPYRIITKELDVPATRDICFVLRDSATAPLAVRRFKEYLRG
ncbi:MAG: LysR family transcriptional regulator [Firmicutes bacterium]|nr:LysR family transcriptional regulator [Bacillota bacterium]